MELESWNDASGDASLHWIFSEAEKLDGRSLGVALGSALPVVTFRTWATNIAGGARRSGVAAVVASGATGCMIIAVVHLSWQRDRPDARRVELCRLLDEVTMLQRDHPLAPVMVAGDFNALPDDDEMTVLLGAGFELASVDDGRGARDRFVETRPYARWLAATSAGSCAGVVPPEIFGAIDHCWTRGSSAVAVGATSAVAMIDNEDTVMPLSDHRPLIVDLALTPRASRELAQQT